MLFLPSNRGFTLLEAIASIAIISLLLAVVLVALNDFRAQKSLDASVEEVLAAFAQAHLDTISSKDEMQYGVHLETNQVVYFVGTTYTAGAGTNVVYPLPAPTEISNISLNGGGSEVVFERLSGRTNQYGTFTLRTKRNATLRSVVTINGTGSISL